jgi:hypothetical protein
MNRKLLKRDALGAVWLVETAGGTYVERDTQGARPVLRWLARRLAGREAAALRTLGGAAGIPELLSFDGRVLRRSALPGAPLFAGEAPSRIYFRRAHRLLRTLHRAGVTHNDCAKEANWLRAAPDVVGLVDFQLATCSVRRGAVFRLRAHEDLRHLLKHKATYCSSAMTARERALLTRPVLVTRAWRALFKPIYHLVTRRVLGWRERPGPAEREV